jgi:DNA repair exonuclease SbcCD ATPase subunit
MKKSTCDDPLKYLSAEAIFKNIKNLAFETALERLKQTQSDHELKIELVTLNHEAKTLYEACLDFANRVLDGKVQSVEIFEFPDDNSGFDQIQEEFKELLRTIQEQLRIKEDSVKEYLGVKSQLEKKNEKFKENENDLLKNEEIQKKYQNFSLKMETNNQSFRKKLESVKEKDSFIEKIRGKEENYEDTKVFLNPIPEEEEKALETDKKISKVQEESDKIIHSIKSLSSDCEELKSLIKNFPSITTEKQKLEEKEETLKIHNLTSKNLHSSLSKITEKRRKSQKQLEISLMELSEVNTQILSNIKQKTQKTIQISNLKSFSVTSTQDLILKTLPTRKPSNHHLSSIQSKTFKKILELNNSNEKILENQFNLKKSEIERKVSEELGSWILKKAFPK